jgi:hypothetical protein
MKWMYPFAAATLAACSVQPAPGPATGPQQAHVECIDLSQVTARRVVAPASVVFEMSGGVAYRNDLQGTCPGAARASGLEIVQTETQSTNLCRNDHIRIYDPVEAKATGAQSFASCRVGSFTAVPAP